ncbi:MAG: hypothetical protein KF718_21380 [Polyangiaceae bacterium]|nr:hypothetical protein [Polyangiaceae bacterium]
MKLSNVAKKLLHRTALPLLLLVAAAQPACGVFGSRGPSEVAEGRKFVTGDPMYDQFFSQVFDLSVELNEAPEKEKSLRIALARQLGVEVEEEEIPQPAPTAAATPAAPAATEQPQAPGYGDVLTQSALGLIPGAGAAMGVKQQYDATKAQINGVQQQLEGVKNLSDGASLSTEPAAAQAPTPKKRTIAPAASLLARTVRDQAQKLEVGLRLEADRDAALDGEDAKVKLHVYGEDSGYGGRKLGRQVETAIAAELELVSRMARAQKKLEHLDKLAVALDGNVDVTFQRSVGQKADVRKNLADARRLIQVMKKRAAEVGSKADELVGKLAEVTKAEPPSSDAPPAAVAASGAAPSPSAVKQAPSSAPTQSAPKPEPKPASKAPPKARTVAATDFIP